MLLMPRLGAPKAAGVPEAGPTLLIREDGCGRGCGFQQMLEGSQGPGAAALAARGFFLKGFLCSQGRDASDQHIVDVVLKMLQGEGRGRRRPAQSRSGQHPRFRSLSR